MNEQISSRIKDGILIRKVWSVRNIPAQWYSRLRLKPIVVSLYQVSLPFPAFNSFENENPFRGCKSTTYFQMSKWKVKKNEKSAIFDNHRGSVCIGNKGNYFRNLLCKFIDRLHDPGPFMIVIMDQHDTPGNKPRIKEFKSGMRGIIKVCIHVYQGKPAIPDYLLRSWKMSLVNPDILIAIYILYYTFLIRISKMNRGILRCSASPIRKRRMWLWNYIILKAHRLRRS